MKELIRLKHLCKWLKPYKWWTFGLFIGALLFFTLAQIPPIFMSWLIDNALPSGEIRTALIIVIGYFGIIMARHIFSIVIDYAYTYVGARISIDMQVELLNHILKSDLRHIYSQQLGDLIARLNDDVEYIREFLSETIVDIISNVVTLCIALIIMTWFNWKLALSVALLLPIIPLPFKWMRRPLRKAFSAQRKAFGANTAFIQEMLSGVLPIQIAQAYKKVRIQQKKVTDTLVRTTLKMRFKQIIAAYSAEVTGNFLSPLLVLGFGSYLVFQNELTVGQLVACHMYASQLVGPVVVLSKINAMLQGVFAAMDRVDEITNAPQREPEFLTLPASATGYIRVQNVTFLYRDTETVIRNCSLNIPFGKRIAVVGSSGSGKTTLAYLLAGIFPPNEGFVQMDGIPIHNLKNRSEIITMATQDPFLFHDTIKENISFGLHNLTDSEIEEAARAASIHDFIKSLPDGYDTMIGERGVTISGGERQRMMLARSFLKQHRILILDEVTSALDSTTELEVLKSLDALKNKTTVILITHRITTAMNADFVYVMKQGQIVEEGNPRELLNRNGEFSLLHINQTGYRGTADITINALLV